MSENVSMPGLMNALQSNVKGKDLSGLNGKVMNEVSLFQNINGQEQFNDKLTNKDDFAASFMVQGNEQSVTAEQLGEIYDMLDVDHDGQVSETELKLLASLGGENNANKIDVEDFVVLANMSKTGEPQMTQAPPEQQGVRDIPVGTTVNSVLKNDPRIQQDANGQKFVTVEDWAGSGEANDCLDAIIGNSYDLAAMGIEANSEEYNTLLNAVMDANPQIYGTKEGGWREEVGGEGRQNAVLYQGDNIVLPDFQYVKQAKPEVPSEGSYGAYEGYGTYAPEERSGRGYEPQSPSEPDSGNKHDDDKAVSDRVRSKISVNDRIKELEEKARAGTITEEERNEAQSLYEQREALERANKS